jgi:hypothetical protein
MYMKLSESERIAAEWSISALGSLYEILTRFSQVSKEIALVKSGYKHLLEKARDGVLDELKVESKKFYETYGLHCVPYSITTRDSFYCELKIMSGDNLILKLLPAA